MNEVHEKTALDSEVLSNVRKEFPAGSVDCFLSMSRDVNALWTTAFVLDNHIFHPDLWLPYPEPGMKE